MTWWAEQLQDLLPQRLSMKVHYGDALVVRAEAGTLAVAVRRRGRETPLGLATQGNSAIRRVRARPPGPIVLALPADALLEQAVSLPLAAERDLAAVLETEMDRLTPFRAADLFWTWRLDRRDRVNKRLILRLLLIPRRALVPVLDALDAAGFHPAVLEAAGEDGRDEYLPITAHKARSRSFGSPRLALSVCAVSAVLAFVVPIARQERAIAQAESAVTALRPRVALVEGLRRRIGANASDSDLFEAERARVGNPLRALAAVTAALPYDTYLTAFAMRDRKLSLAGRSGAAARLIAALSANPALRDPAFDAPVTRVSDKLDLFSIRAEMLP